MAAERKSESKLAEATERTTATLEGLRARLRREAAPSAPEETPEDLGRQLEEYFSATIAGDAPASSAADGPANTPSALMDLVRERIIDSAADRILKTWDQPGGESIKNEIVRRVVDRVLQELAK